MAKEFNVTGTCIPDEHYMVDTSLKLEQIISLIHKGKYFTINRARQYGKTTTLAMLYRRLKDEYVVIRLSFEGIGEESFKDNTVFVRMFVSKVGKFFRRTNFSGMAYEKWCRLDEEVLLKSDPFDYLSDKITDLCVDSGKDVILLIDEVDKTSDNQVFLNFLGMLRSKYLDRAEGLDHTFKSVILASVYDVKNLKLKMHPNEGKKYNSPWNIAVDFNVDMSFSPEEIAAMLEEYEADYHTDMDIQTISQEIYFYTSGYPFLVSCLCKWIDECGSKIWTVEGVRNAEKELLKTRNTLFDDLVKNVENHEELRSLIESILYDGYSQSFNISDPVIELGAMLGIFVERDHNVAISNLIFETYLYDYVVSVKSRQQIILSPERSQFIRNGRLDMTHVMIKFQELMKAEYRKEDGKFLEQQGRLLFLCFLKPIINGTGFYYVEPQTRNSSRMDIVVVYGKEEFIIELKIWHGDQYRRDGIKQLENYLDSRGNENGYLVSFSFMKHKEYTKAYLRKEETKKNIFEIIV